MVRQSGLGKGLGALLPTTDVEATVSGGPPSARLSEVPISAIRPNTYQPRSTFADEGIESLAASIKELGVLQPVLLRPAENGQYELIAGERRWRAARRAGLTSIPAVIRSAADQDSLEQALVENLHRADLNPLEEASAYQQLIDDFSFTHDQVATRVGKSRAAISNTLRLFQLSPSIQRMVLDGQVDAGHARALLGTSDKAFQETLARRVAKESLSVRAVEEAVRLREQGPSPATKTAKKAVADRPAGLLELEEVLGQMLDTRVSVELVPNKRGRMTVEFADLADLERIFRIVTSSAGSADDADDADDADTDAD